MPGDIGLVAQLLTTVIGWAVNPDGLASMERETRLKEIHHAMLVAVQAGQFDAADQLFVALKRMSQEIA